jgi:hypothetical protein
MSKMGVLTVEGSSFLIFLLIGTIYGKIRMAVL